MELNKNGQNDNQDTQTKKGKHLWRDEQTTNILENISNNDNLKPADIDIMCANINEGNILTQSEQEEIDQINEGSFNNQKAIKVSEKEFSKYMKEERKKSDKLHMEFLKKLKKKHKIILIGN